MRYPVVTKRIAQLLVIVPVVLMLWSQTAFSGETKLVSVAVKKTPFEIDIPANWGKGAFSGESVLLSRSPGGALYPNLNVVIQDRKDLSLEQAHKNWLKLLNNPQIFSEQAVTINGIQAHFSAITWNSLLGGLKAITLFVEQKNKHIKITYVDRADNTTKADIDLYIKSINTLRHIRPAGTE